MTADFCGFICSLFAMHHLLRFCNSILQFNSRSVRDELLRNRQAKVLPPAKVKPALETYFVKTVDQLDML